MTIGIDWLIGWLVGWLVDWLVGFVCCMWRYTQTERERETGSE